MMVDWQDYPQCLRKHALDPYLYGLESYRQRLESDANRLFMVEEKTAVQVLEASSSLGPRVLNSRQLGEYLEETSHHGMRIISVAQQTSWGKLWISYNAMRRLLTRFSVFPTILDLLRAFGQYTSPINESMGCAQILSQPDSATTEICYLLKHVEKHGRDFPANQWSIRQIGVYHKRNRQTQENTFITFNPSLDFSKRLRKTQEESLKPTTWEDIHVLGLSCASTQWGNQLNETDEQLELLKIKAHNSDLPDKGKGSAERNIRIQFSDMQKLEVLHDELHRIKHALSNNLEASRKIMQLFSEEPGTCASPPGKACSRAQMCISETTQQKRRAETMISRLNAVSQLMQTIVSVRGLTALQSSSESSTEMMHLARVDSNTMVGLSKKAHYDSRSLKTITVLTLFYLPASFVSQLLSMGYISIDRDKHPVALHLASELWIFLGLTIILLVITVGGWLFLDWRRKRKRASHEAGEAAALFGGKEGV